MRQAFRQLQRAWARLFCRHRWSFAARLPEINGRSAVRVWCCKCGFVDEFKDAKIIG